jgi:hypothetical protein
MRSLLLVVLLLLSSTISHVSGATSSIGTKRHGFRHAYYLFLSGTPAGCEDCYIPLLITTESIEEVTRGKTRVWITSEGYLTEQLVRLAVQVAGQHQL